MQLPYHTLHLSYNAHNRLTGIPSQKLSEIKRKQNFGIHNKQWAKLAIDLTCNSVNCYAICGYTDFVWYSVFGLLASQSVSQWTNADPKTACEQVRFISHTKRVHIPFL